jgi:hypothetical protein
MAYTAIGDVAVDVENVYGTDLTTSVIQATITGGLAGKIGVNAVDAANCTGIAVFDSSSSLVTDGEDTVCIGLVDSDDVETAGTGTLTIAAPNTNSDRTLSLPDAAGEMYNQGNILGTVSQSGGVPTGAIIERGSNANGEFVKFADGTLICTFKEFQAIPGGTGASSLTETWTYPHAFSPTPDYVNASRGTLATTDVARTTTTAQRTGSRTTTTCNFFTVVTTTTSSETRIDVTAIGRWF